MVAFATRRVGRDGATRARLGRGMSMYPSAIDEAFNEGVSQGVQAIDSGKIQGI